MLQLITAKDNPSVKQYRRLARSKKDRQQTGQFVLEGYRLVRDAAAHGAAFTVLFFTEDAWKRCQTDGGIGADLRETKLLLISNELAMYMGETEHPQGVFGICRIPECTLSLKRNGRYVVLHQLQDPGNMGTILRTADAMGIDGVLCCGTCDVYSPKVVRSTMGSLFRLPMMVQSDAERVFSLLHEQEILSCAAVVDSDAESVGACSLGSGCAVWIGNEGNGLPAEISTRCERRLTIPMHGTIESLNAAMAAGILMWEMVRAASAEEK